MVDRQPALQAEIMPLEEMIPTTRRHYDWWGRVLEQLAQEPNSDPGKAGATAWVHRIRARLLVNQA